MIIKSIHVKNFRGVLDACLSCEPLTAIVGANGAGKSSFLRALELFYAPSPRVSTEDFYNCDASSNIEITVDFTNLEEQAVELFGAYVDDDALGITRVLSLLDGKTTAKLYGTKLQNPDFVPIREAGGASPARQKYNEIRQSHEYSELPAAGSQTAVLEALTAWEREHPEKCIRQRDEGQFFGFTEVGAGYLGRFTRLISIPAVRDAAEDAAEGKGHPITEILDLVVRASLAGREELRELKTQAQERYDQIMKTSVGSELSEIQNGLTETLNTYVPDAQVQLDWITEGGVEFSLPKADVRLVENGYSTSVVRSGHGLQRAFILTMLQKLEAAHAEAPAARFLQNDATEGTSQPSAEAGISFSMSSLVLCIEEPELYQHPNRQRHLAKILLRLADGAVPGVAKQTQILYSTHCPLFVGIDRFERIRLLRKVSDQADKPRVTRVVQVKGDEVAETLWEACGKRDRNGKPVPQFTWHDLKPRLEGIMTPMMSEGFFAEAVVLVEGEDDRAAILAVAQFKGIDLESAGVSVLYCRGKSCIDRPFLIFRRFEVPTYVVWDGDKTKPNSNPKENHHLLRLLGSEVVDWPCGVHEHFACFEKDLEDTVRTEIGTERYDSLLAQLQEEHGFSSRDDAKKNPQIFREMLDRAHAQQAKSATLESIVDSILKLKGAEVPAP